MIVKGTVVRGDGRGRGLGWPTANIAVPDDFAAADGVYAARVKIDGESGTFAAMANLGRKPTFGGGGDRVLELHLFDFEGDLYGREISAELVRHIRPERKFGNPTALRAQIAEDRKSIEKILCI
ncbi:MAG: riboflavin kinase [Alistipes sp.]|jgi:riboflavin kinase/FMN adenylyltransferase|nr:riboflavin kinase [Alistipes sp.]